MFRVHNPLDITDVTPTPVLIAALGPLMLRLAGERTDGTILWMADERAIGVAHRSHPHRGGRGRRPAGAPDRRRRPGLPVRRRRGRGRGRPGPTASSPRPRSRRTTSSCSTRATPATSATSSPRAASRRSRSACSPSPTPASPTCRSGWCRSATDGTSSSPPRSGPGRSSPTWPVEADLVVGFVGLGNMGSALAANLVAAGHEVVAYDAAGAGAHPGGRRRAADVAAEVARQADVVVLSLPDGAASEVGGRADRRRRRTGAPPTSSTRRPSACAPRRRSSARLADAGIGYVDAPVSGGVAGARARTLTVMYAADRRRPAPRVEPVLAGLSDRCTRVGDRPGHGPGAEAGQQLPVRHRARRDQRGAGLRAIGRSRPGHDDRGAGRIERSQRGHERQVPEPRADRSVTPPASPTP